MKHLLSLIMLFIVTTSTTVIAQQSVTLYCDDAYPPYAYGENGIAKGIYIDILKKAFDNIPDYDVTIKPVPWKRGVGMIESGEALALIPPYKHLEKRPYMFPYSESILQEEVVLYVNKASHDGSKTTWPDDYFGKTIGMNAGFAVGGEAYGEALAAGKIKEETAADNTKNILKLYNGRIDGYVNDRIATKQTISELVKKGQITENVLVEATVVGSNWGYVGYSKPNNVAYKDDFIKKVDVEIKKLKEAGVVKQVIESYTK